MNWTVSTNGGDDCSIANASGEVVGTIYGCTDEVMAWLLGKGDKAATDVVKVSETPEPDPADGFEVELIGSDGLIAATLGCVKPELLNWLETQAASS